MANTSEDVNESQWVEERLRALREHNACQPDIVRAWARLQERQRAAARRTRHAWTAVVAATAGLTLLALPWPRTAAQRLWERLSLGRVEVVQVSRADLPESVAASFAMEPKPWDREPVKDAAEAERVSGFRPSLPAAGLLPGIPSLSVVRSISIATKPLKTSDIERALATAGLSDITVPKEWEGTTLIAEGGPIVVADYSDANVELMESAPFRMTVPSGFQFARFVEIAFRVFGKSAHDARRLSKKFAANPALMMHFPERSQVREVALRSGQGVLVGDPGGNGICFFWNTADRIYIVSAEKMTQDQAVMLANSMR